MKEEKKKIQNKMFYILGVFTLCCIMIYFKDSWEFIPSVIIAILFPMVFNKLNKKYNFFILLLLSLLFIPNSNVYAENLYSPKEIKEAMLSLNWPEVPFSNTNKDYVITYDAYGNGDGTNPGVKFQTYKVQYCSDISYYYNFSNGYFSHQSRGCYTFYFDELIYDETGKLVDGTYQASTAHTGGGTYSFGCANGEPGFDNSDFKYCEQNFKILSASEDIVFTDDNLFGVDNQVVFYKKADKEIYEEFGYDLSNVDGYSYYTLSSGEQVVLYPKTLEAFEFYLFYLNGGLAVDILDTVGSNISTSEHQEIINDGTNNVGFQYKKLSYSEEDALNKRGVYLTNFRSDSANIQFGYKTDLFELLIFDESGIATTSDGKVTFSNTYDLIKDKNNIIDANDKLGNFDSLISNPTSLASQLTNAFKSFGQLITMFFTSMPDFIVEGFQLMLILIIVIGIIKALL